MPAKKRTKSQLNLRVWIILLAILAFSVFVRFIDLGGNPNGLFVDEAFTGYDAYCIAETGRDLWGERLPVFFKSWGDYNSGLYRYLSVPWVAVMGLNETSTRATAAFIGALTVLFTFLLARRLLSHRAGLVAAAFLAISPWHFQFSRIAFRGILLPFCLTLAVLLFMKSLEKRPGWLIASLAVFGITLYTYSPARVIVPLFLIFLFIWKRRELARMKIALAISLVLFTSLAIPLAQLTIEGEGQQRYHLVSILEDSNLEAETCKLAEQNHTLYQIVNSTKATKIAYVFAKNYLSHFTPSFLLLSGDENLRHSPEGFGQLNWAVFFLFAIGLIMVIRRRREFWLLLFWILVAPVPDSLTTDNVPNALRAIAFLPAAQIVAALTAVAIIRQGSQGSRNSSPKPSKLRAAAAVGIAIAALTGSGLHFQNYFTDYKRDSAPWWDYGYREAIAYCESEGSEFESVVIIGPGRSEMITYANNPFAYAFPLFYMKYDPELLQTTKRVGRYDVVFLPGDDRVSNQMLERGVLYVIRGRQAGNVNTLHTIYYPSGRLAFAIAAREKFADIGPREQ
jgi:4-amino-4-deoxy-L-arabinose transferase-like glycosyltransferase